ncbi:MAG: tRNA (guanosine(37)-N1)-methyltransferase TrmD [Candidatus Cloacimonadota bacterium]|nr:MAG: tRNA (guanosine(37)-N1)-methyltransferase TrmD [Candidatus Cloacimonadota bacterium]
MKIDILTLFPEYFSDFFQISIVGNAVEAGKIQPTVTDIRDFAFNKHRQVDDYPYGGGAGMVMKPEPIAEAIDFLHAEKDVPVIYFTPQGKPLTQKTVRYFAEKERVILLCGHYKEIDQRIRDLYVSHEISTGDYVLSCGELPAMIFVDAVARLQDGVIGDLNSALTDSFEINLLGCPHYTRPSEFRNCCVPDVLLSGNHKKIDDWRNKKSMEITAEVRPDILKRNDK